MGENSLKSHMIKLLNLDDNIVNADGLGDLNTEIKRYRNFLSKLHVKERNQEADRIYKKMHDSNITVGNLVTKKKGEDTILDEMKEIFFAQEKYYNEKLKKYYETEVLKHYRLKEAYIEMYELKNKNSIWDEKLDDVIVEKYSWDLYLQQLNRQWEEFSEYLNLILTTFFSLNNRVSIKRDDISWNFDEKVLDDEIKYYNRIKSNYALLKLEEENDNPYKNLYVFYRNLYILNFYEIKLPKVEGFLDLKKYELPFRKEKYTLRDIAEIYSYMMELYDDKDVYGNIKKFFQKYKCMDNFKNSGHYEFEEVSIPLAVYAYYRKKNHKFPTESNSALPDIIYNRYAPLLNTMINEEQDKINVYVKMRKFYLEEFYDMYSTLNCDYQKNMLSFLMSSPCRIFSRAVGLPFEKVYWDWKIAFSE